MHHSAAAVPSPEGGSGFSIATTSDRIGLLAEIMLLGLCATLALASRTADAGFWKMYCCRRLFDKFTA
jgi:hypothetical protein